MPVRGRTLVPVARRVKEQQQTSVLEPEVILLTLPAGTEETDACRLYDWLAGRGAVQALANLDAPGRMRRILTEPLEPEHAPADAGTHILTDGQPAADNRRRAFRRADDSVCGAPRQGQNAGTYCQQPPPGPRQPDGVATSHVHRQHANPKDHSGSCRHGNHHRRRRAGPAEQQPPRRQSSPRWRPPPPWHQSIRPYRPSRRPPPGYRPHSRPTTTVPNTISLITNASAEAYCKATSPPAYLSPPPS